MRVDPETVCVHAAAALLPQDWIQRYKESRARATAELLTFLVQAGCAVLRCVLPC